MEDNRRPSPERPMMTDSAASTINALLTAREPIVDVRLCNDMVRGFVRNDAFDPRQIVGDFMRSSSHIAALYGVDIGLLRPSLLSEHTEADLGGFEKDYRPLFGDNAEALKILRLASLLKDSGKSLCVKETGDNQRQAEYNKRITNNVLDALDPDTLADDSKEVVRLLVDQDIIGGALQGRFDQEKLDELRAKWPSRYSGNFDDFMIVSYLSDASAHTKYRPQSRVRPEDEEKNQTLTFLFEEPKEREPLTLTQPYQGIVAELFPERNVTRALIPNTEETTPPTTHDYEISRGADDIWSATFSVPSGTFAEIKQALESNTMETDFPFSALVKRGRNDSVTEITFVRDPSRRFGTPLSEECEQVVSALSGQLGWERIPSETPGDVSACVGLEEGYGTEIVHKPVEQLAYLLTHGKAMKWKTEPTHLISTRKVFDGQARQDKLFSYDEPVMRIVGSAREEASEGNNPALDQILKLAGTFNQQRIFVDDYRRDKTMAYAAVA